jgi:hypothetical protein
MGFLDNTSITVDAILTYRGRQILSQGGTLAISKFALSDEEVDYTLYDVTHPNGTDSYGAVIENMNLIEAIPNRDNFRSHLTDANLSGASIGIVTSYPNMAHSQDITIVVTPQGGAPTEAYIFTIDNINVVKFISQPTTDTVTARVAAVRAQSIFPGRTAIVTIVGVESGLAAQVHIFVKTHETSANDPDKSQDFQQDTQNTQKEFKNR